MSLVAWVAREAEAATAMGAAFDGVARRRGDGAVEVTLRSSDVVLLHPVDGRRAAQDGWPALPDGRHGFLLSAGDRVLDAVPIPALSRLAAQARDLGARLGASGALEAPDVPRLAAAGVDLLLFGRALREDGALDPRRMAAVVGRTPNEAIVAAGPRDRIFVRDLVLEMEIGAYRSERGRRQRVRVCVEAEVDPVGRRAQTVADIVSYDLIVDAVARLAEAGHVDLVETFAEAIAHDLLGVGRVALVRVRVEKLDLGPGAVGVEIERRRTLPS